MTKLYDDGTSSTGSAQILTYNNGFLGIGAYGLGPIYQSFSSGSASASLTTISLKLYDATALTDGGNLTVGLYSNSGSLAGSLVGTLGTIQDTAISTVAGGAFISITSTLSTLLTAGTTYWIGLTSSLSSNSNAGPYWDYTNAPTGSTGYASESNSGGVATINTANELLMVVNDSSLCFAAGAQILTARGEVSVETLVEGDLVVGIRSGRLQPVRWIGRRDVDLSAHPNPASINPVRVCADAFSPGQPHRDLILSPNHALYVDGHLIAVRYLLNGATIRQEQWDRVTYYHVELEAHDVMLVDGMTAESFLDIGNRGAFSNGGEPVMLHPDFARQMWEAEACAPDLPKGEDLTRLRATLLERAPRLGHALTDDPDLCVMVGKRRIRPIEIAEGFRFNLPKGTTTARIESRCFRPSDVRPDGIDSRLLGIGVLSLTLDDRQIALDDSRLTAGWHDLEPGLRWTKGEATLRTDGARALTVELFRGRHYWVAAEDNQTAHVAA